MAFSGSKLQLLCQFPKYNGVKILLKCLSSVIQHVVREFDGGYTTASYR